MGGGERDNGGGGEKELKDRVLMWVSMFDQELFLKWSHKHLKFHDIQPVMENEFLSMT
jgi:hypothetical protein